MPTFTWSKTSFFTTGPLITAPFGGLSLPIPANGILKHFIIRNTILYGVQSSTDVNGQPGLTVSWNVTFFDTNSLAHEIYQTRRATRRTDTVWAEIAPLFAHYTVIDTAGDNELGVNQSCSFGRHTDPAPKLLGLSAGIDGDWNGHTLHRDGVFGYELKMLVETIP